jgi:ABC-type Zn2+ transport system substrate-binding protein/surface adhesin|tara:strand:+ start:685 stop:1083 length:399 start_codon:yes stop_codon:yes gene_type:complete
MAAGLAASREGSMVSGIRDRSRETDQDSRDDSPTNNNQEKQMHVEENEGDEHDHDHENNADRTPQHAVVAADFAGSILSNRNSKKSGTALNTIRSTSPGKSALSANRNKLISGLKDGLPPSPRLEAMNEEDE